LGPVAGDLFITRVVTGLPVASPFMASNLLGLDTRNSAERIVTFDDNFRTLPLPGRLRT
jgi:hypothetical protein